jgi:hypothetical protein
LEAEFLRLLGAQLGRIPLGRKEDNGRVERGHRTDDEAFYLPCVLSLESVEAFLGAGLGWLLARVAQVEWLPVVRVEAGMRAVARAAFRGVSMPADLSAVSPTVLHANPLSVTFRSGQGLTFASSRQCGVPLRASAFTAADFTAAQADKFCDPCTLAYPARAAVLGYHAFWNAQPSVAPMGFVDAGAVGERADAARCAGLCAGVRARRGGCALLRIRDHAPVFRPPMLVRAVPRVQRA